MLKVVILGAGAWGIGLGLAIKRAGHDVTIWSPYLEEIKYIKTHHRHPTVLKDIMIPATLKFTSNLEDIREAQIVLCVVPAQVLRQVVVQCRDHINQEATIISCGKGIEIATGEFLSCIIKKELPNHRVGTISGPNFAHEVVLDLPAQSVLGLENFEEAQCLALQLSHENFHLIPSCDVKGIELSSAFKNVLAIGSGIITGYCLGENARAAYLTQGVQDLMLLGRQLNCDPQTFTSVAGIGDMMLTCLSSTSRNMSYGIEIGKRNQLDNVNSIDHPLAEGIYTVKAMLAVMEQQQINLPSVIFVEQILYHKRNIADAFKQLKL